MRSAGFTRELAAGPARSRADTMQASFEDACVTDWEGLVAGISLPDPDGRHVVAAALQGRADMVVTANVRGFPIEILDSLSLEVQHPDESSAAERLFSDGASRGRLGLRLGRGWWLLIQDSDRPSVRAMSRERAPVF